MIDGQVFALDLIAAVLIGFAAGRLAGVREGLWWGRCEAGIYQALSAGIDLGRQQILSELQAAAEAEPDEAVIPFRMPGDDA